jgi:transmembrane sensor
MTHSTPKLSVQILEEASDWFVEFSEGTSDAAARERFDTWLRRSPEHVQAYLKIAALWEDAALLEKGRTLADDELLAHAIAQPHVVPFSSPRLSRLPEEPTAQVSGLPPPVSADDTTKEPFQPSASLKSEVGSPSVPPTRHFASEKPKATLGALRLRIVLAASFILVTLLAGTWFYLQRGTYYTTVIGEQRSVRLEDGSTVDLNSLSKVRVRFSEHRRDVELLEGQALFHVAKDAWRPFVVAIGNTQVRAVGTQFDVYRKNSGTVVTVLEGRVAVRSDLQPASALAAPGRSAKLEGEVSTPHVRPDGTASRESETGSARRTAKVAPSLRTETLLKAPDPPPSTSAQDAASTTSGLLAGLVPQDGEILLAAGEQLTVTPQAVSEPKAADVAVATAWTQRKIAFKGARLSDVVEEFNRYNTRPLVLVDPDLKSIKISGVFSSTDPDSLLQFLRDLPHIDVQVKAHEVRISRK